MLASVVWWAVFYSPGDLVYSLAKNKLLYLPICVVKEIIRGKKLVGGISAARAVFPDNELIIIIIAVIKGNGSSFMKPITKLILGINLCSLGIILSRIDQETGLHLNQRF